jgi:hypothetical protein
VLAGESLVDIATRTFLPALTLSASKRQLIAPTSTCSVGCSVISLKKWRGASCSTLSSLAASECTSSCGTHRCHCCYLVIVLWLLLIAMLSLTGVSWSAGTALSPDFRCSRHLRAPEHDEASACWALPVLSGTDEDHRIDFGLRVCFCLTTQQDCYSRIMRLRRCQ